MFIYDILMWLAAIVVIPKSLIISKYKKNLLERLGVGFPQIKKGKRSLIWIHAVSVGETVAVAPLAKRLKSRKNSPILIVTNITATGHSQAKKSLPFADYHLYLPFDFSWVIKPIVRRVKPDLVLLCETDFWYNFLKCSKEVGAKLAVVNGKLSERSLKRYQKLSWFTRHLFGLFDLFCVQSEHYQERFLAMGIPEEKVVVTGNLKFDGETIPLSKKSLKKELNIDPSDEVFVVGSTHDPEEKMILDLLPALWRKNPNVTVMIVPRHPERFAAVEQMIQNRIIPYRKFSQGTKNGKERVILVDAMGVLRKCYQVSDLALVAGSFTPNVGGHNIIEPSWYGVPVLFGPYMHSQPELLELALTHQSALQVDSKTLLETIIRLFSGSAERNEIGERGAAMVKKLAGATEKTENRLQEIARF